MDGKCLDSSDGKQMVEETCFYLGVADIIVSRCVSLHSYLGVGLSRSVSVPCLRSLFTNLKQLLSVVSEIPRLIRNRTSKIHRREGCLYPRQRTSNLCGLAK
jgi:hypothetical protein